jgi:hypothetical protein
MDFRITFTDIVVLDDTVVFNDTIVVSDVDSAEEALRIALKHRVEFPLPGQSKEGQPLVEEIYGHSHARP